MTASPDGAPRRSPFLRFAPIACILLGLAAFFAFGLNRYVSCDALRDNRSALMDWVARHQLLAPIAFVVGYAVVAALSLPVASLVSIGGGFVFGTWLGTVLNVLGATLGATGLFLAARTAFADVLRERAGPAVQKMRAGFAANAFSYLLFLRLVPLFFFWLVNLVPALLGVPLGTFIAATFIGIIPGAFVYTNVGSKLGDIFSNGGSCSLHDLVRPGILVALGMLGCLSLLPVLYRKLKGAHG